jgi:cytochrome c553
VFLMVEICGLPALGKTFQTLADRTTTHLPTTSFAMSYRTLSFLILAAGLGQIASLVHAAEPATTSVGTVLFKNICANCHGQKGEGNPLLKAPCIAGLPTWYVKAQVHNFREGRRGTDPQDPQALLMAATVKALQVEHIEAVAKVVETLEPIPPPAPAKKPSDDALAEGRLLFEERCMECHRYNGTGELAFGSARLLGLQDWYLKAQLHKFKTGKRGAVPGDDNGLKMVFAVQHIETDADLDAVVAYILTLNWMGDPFAAQH